MAALALIAAIAVVIYFKHFKQSTTPTKIQPGVDLLNEAQHVKGDNNNDEDLEKNHNKDEELMKNNDIKSDKGITMWT